jgi:uncharacterized membrane protein
VSEGRQPPSDEDETEEEDGQLGFFEKLLAWLGRFHPASVHFPIALLVAASVAVLLHRITGKEGFAASARFCLWLGTLTAGGAGVLGWFLAGFRLTDASWILTTHRWLGTAVVACAGLALVLGERGHRPDRRRTRAGFLVALGVLAALVLATGFFGGAVVFGLGHYAWPH